MLQLFIIFSRPDREPSIVQILSILSSFISLVLARLSFRFASQPGARFKERLKFFPYELCLIFYIFLDNAVILLIFRYQTLHYYLFALAGGITLLIIYLIVTLIFRNVIKTTWFTKWAFTKCPKMFHEIMKFGVLFTQISVIFVFNFVLIEFVVNASHYLDTPIRYMGGTKLVRDL